MNFKTFTLIASSILLSCGNPSEDQPSDSTKIVSTVEQVNTSETEAIQLNNGEKWKLEEELLNPIQEMEKEINSFAMAEKKDYKLFAARLQKTIELITSKCNREDKAHDTLHRWLVPFMDTVTELGASADESEAAKKFEELQTSFKTFNEYFQ